MGELARRPGCPELAATPLELLDTHSGQGYNLFEKWAWPCLAGVAGVLCMINRNFTRRRPVWSGIQYHILMGGGFAYAATFIRDYRFAAQSEANEAYKYYVTLHPEDFPPFDRKRYRDVYEPFKPVR